MRSRRSLIPFVLLATLAWGCSKQLPTQPTIEAVSADPVRQEATELRRDGAAQVTGSTRSGSLFALYRPANWKGDLVLYAHGFTPPSDPIHLPPIDALRDQLLARGFAVAYSSFSENGLAVRDGMRHTARVEEMFESRLGRARRVFLIGSSFGGLIAVGLAERESEHYSGLLTVCGLTGGTRLLTDYVAHVRVLFDVFYPNVLQGDLMHIPPGLNLNQHVIGPAVQAMSASPQGAFAIAQLVQPPVPFANGPELVGSIATALGLHFIELEDLLQRTEGQSFFNNTSHVYTGPLPQAVLDDVNARVARYSTTEEVDEFFDHAYEPSGRLRMPMLALYNTRDAQVNAAHQARYAERVAQRGTASLLEQRATVRYGHTELFTPEEIAAAFQEVADRAPRRHRHHGDERDDVIAASGGGR